MVSPVPIIVGPEMSTILDPKHHCSTCTARTAPHADSVNKRSASTPKVSPCCTRVRNPSSGAGSNPELSFDDHFPKPLAAALAAAGLALELQDEARSGDSTGPVLTNAQDLAQNKGKAGHVSGYAAKPYRTRPRDKWLWVNQTNIPGPFAHIDTEWPVR